MSIPEYIAAIGEESPAQELVCDDNLTEYQWDSPTFIYSSAQICTYVHFVKRYSVSRFSISSSTLIGSIQGQASLVFKHCLDFELQRRIQIILTILACLLCGIYAYSIYYHLC
jgi:hypothetical protein